ncbi:hypothetical protein [Gimesia sp.]|uniref:hypothetical protein n=1 Tax=Gimesia sp. TaxID=2024833 RepID=UPI003A91D9E3
MNDHSLKRQPEFCISAIMFPFFLACCLSAVSGCEQTSAPKAISENSSSENQPEVETSVPPASQQASPAGVSDRSEDQQVSVTLEVPEQTIKAGERFPLTVKFEIAPLWEIRALDAQPVNVVTQLKLALPEGFQTQGDWQAPPSGRSLSADSHPVYSGRVEFQQLIQAREDIKPGEYDISCQVQYQACDEHRCLSPTHKKLQLTVRIK